VSLRALAPSDAEAVLAVIQAAFAAQGAATDPPSGALAETAASLAARIGRGGGAGFWREGALTGVVFWERTGEALELGRLAVLPAFRRQGVAASLVEAAAAAGRAAGCVRLRLGTRVELTDNQRLFARLGFLETGRTAHPGYDRPTSVTMERPL
jgi:GNAT superfamily N-acetyltransferase